MTSYRHAEASRPVSFGPLVRTVLTVAGLALVAYGAMAAIESVSDLFGPASMSVAGFEPSRIGLGGTERVAGEAATTPIDYLPARLTVNATSDDGPQPDTF